MFSERGDPGNPDKSRLSNWKRFSADDPVARERFEAARGQLTSWYEEWKPDPEREAARYVVCVGLAVLHRMREGLPISREQYVSGLDVRTSGPLIRNILAGHGIHRMYASAGGRTSGAAILAAEALVKRMNPLTEGWHLNADERDVLIDGLQTWLIRKVELYFVTHPLPASPLHSNRTSSRETG